MTLLTVPIAAKSLKEAASQIKAAAKAGAEMLELRADYLEDLSTSLVEKLMLQAKSANLPIIVTPRDSKQGGANEYPDKLRIDVFVAAIKAGADFIDFEFENFSGQNQEAITKTLSENSKSRLILSAHNFETKFDDIKKLYSQIKEAYSDAIPKLVYTANHINDCFDAFDLLHEIKDDLITFCMGQAGLISRIIAKKLNSFVTFASIDDKTATASGQLTIENFKNLYRYDSISSDTKLYGIIGSPVAHSLSPLIHNACFADIGVNKLYLPLLIEGGKDEFNTFMQNVLERDWLGFKGFSVTIPHKRNAIDLARDNKGLVEPLTEKIGAANTLIIDEPKVSVYNTDYAGALDAVISTLGIAKSDFADMSIAVMGAGGVARAIVAGLHDAKAKVTIYNRTVEKGEKLAAEFGCSFLPLDDLLDVDAQLFINCTSIGMHPNVDASPLPKSCLHKDMAVFDTVYNPPNTLLLKQAGQIGAKTVNGLEMFINQALAQFKLFTGKNPDLKLMQKILYDRLF
ncbi:MAG: shikimate dehydrogenase [Planctomycetes bacterium]|nr:shikimate dehydrogenase [Planctomycetota bacterium]